MLTVNFLSLLLIKLPRFPNWLLMLPTKDITNTKTKQNKTRKSPCGKCKRRTTRGKTYSSISYPGGGGIYLRVPLAPSWPRGRGTYLGVPPPHDLARGGGGCWECRGTGGTCLGWLEVPTLGYLSPSWPGGGVPTLGYPIPWPGWRGRVHRPFTPRVWEGCTVPFTVQPFAYTSCTSRLRAPQGSHRMGDQWHQL